MLFVTVDVLCYSVILSVNVFPVYSLRSGLKCVNVYFLFISVLLLFVSIREPVKVFTN